MAIPATCLHWAKLEDRLVEKGTDWTENGAVTYEPVHFNNGVRCDVTTEFLSIANFIDGLNLNVGCIEFWCKFLFDETTAEARPIFSIGGIGAGGVTHIFCYFNQTDNQFHLQVVGNNAAPTSMEVVTGAFSWDPNDIAHIAFVWDKDNGLGGFRGAIYWDAVNIVTGAVQNNDWSAFPFPAPLPFRLASMGLGWNPAIIIDNLKIWNYAKTDFSDRFVEGFAEDVIVRKIWSYEVPAYEPPAPTPKLFAPVRSRVEIIGDTDIYKLGFINNIGNITESRSFRKDKMIDNEIRIPVDNKALAFSPGNSKSLFSGTNWYFSQVKIWDENNIQIWDGLLWDIIRNSQARTAFLVSRSVMSRIKNIKVVYESAAYETGADALMNIFDAAEFTNYNQRTFQESAATLTAAGALMYLKVTAEDNMSMQNIIAKVSEYCAADAYGHLGEIYLKVWKKITASGSIPILEKDILKQPVTQSAMSEIINTYSIGYSGDEGTPATDEGNNNIGLVSRRLYGMRSLPELSTGDENQIVFPTLASAIWIGEQYIKRTHRNIDTTPLPLIMSSLSVDGRLKNFIDLETILGLTYSDEGFSNETMEPFKFVRNNDRNIVDLVLYTAAS